MAIRSFLLVSASAFAVLVSGSATAEGPTAMPQKQVMVAPATITLTIQSGYEVIELNSANGLTAGCIGISKDGSVAGGVDKPESGSSYRPVVWKGQTSSAPKGNVDGEVVGFTNDNQPVGYEGVNGFIGNQQLIAQYALGVTQAGKAVGMKLEHDHLHAWIQGDSLKAVNGYSESWAFGGNNAGVVVGYAANGTDDGVVTHPVKWAANGNATVLPGKPNGGGAAFQMNNSGVVVGKVGTNDTNEHAARWDNDQLTVLEDLGGTSSAADVANNGHIVGYSTDKHGYRRGIIWINNKPNDLNAMIDHPSLRTAAPAAVQASQAKLTTHYVSVLAQEWIIEAANAINEKGEICGYGEKVGIKHGLLLKPVTRQITIPIGTVLDDSISKANPSKGDAPSRKPPRKR